MCTLVILRNAPGERGRAWPVILVANRDEMADRSWRAPGRHWPDRPNVFAGMDELAGGSWLGVNDEGMVAAVLNRVGALGPADGMRSRGELPLDALDHSDARTAVEALSDLNPAAYRPFNMVVADNRDGYIISLVDSDDPVADGPAVRVRSIPDGVSMIAAHDPDDISDARIRMYLPRFREAEPPRPANDATGGDWRAWEDLMASRDREAASDPSGAMRVETDRGFGTVCAAAIALPGVGEPDLAPVFRFCAGRPGDAPFAHLLLDDEENQ